MLSEYTRRMEPDAQERRMMRRFDMRLPAVVRLVQENAQDNEFQTETQNVSARGVFFTSTARSRREPAARSPSLSRPISR